MQRKILYILFVFTSFTAYAYANVDAQIEAIQNASVEERFKLMNRFKKDLIQMKEQERINAIKKLTTTTKSTQAKKALDEIRDNTKRNNIQKHIESHHVIEDNIMNEANNHEGEESDD